MELKSLNEIFQNRIFRIPDYQRGYAWRSDDDKEVVAFWNDLMNLPDGKGKYHFTGSLTLQEIGDISKLGLDKWLVENNNYKPWYVVDGQQRLTTAIILLQCVYKFLDNLDSDSDLYFMDQPIDEIKKEIRNQYICRTNKKEDITSYLFGYLNNSESQNYLLREVFEDTFETRHEDLSYYTLNIKNAKAFFIENINQLYQISQCDLGVIEKLYQKLTQQLKFQLIEVNQSDEFNIFVAFETINNRGRQLSNLEKLKNRLIYLTTLYDRDYEFANSNVETGIRKKINNAWAEIYRQLGRNFKQSSNGKVAVLDDDEFLRTHWILYYQYSRKTGSDYVNYLLGSKFTVHNVFKNLAQTESTQETMHDEEDYPAELLEQETRKTPEESSLTLNEITEYVKDLQNTAEMWYYTWFPRDAKGKLSDLEIEWMERINRLGIAYFRPLITALFFGRLIPTNEKNKYISQEDSIKLLKAIERFIFIEFRLQTTRSNYGSSEFNIAARELHKGEKSVEDLLGMLQKRIDSSFETDEETNQKYFKTRNMQVLVDKLFEQKDDERAGYYRWSAIHYFLFEYNAELSKGFHGQGKIEWDSFKQSEKDKISIEHIFPHKVEGYWAEQFQQIPQSEWPIYQGSLGNLLLLSQKINAKLQNDDFQTKKDGRQGSDEEERVGYKRGSVSELKISEKDNWTPNEIIQRGLAMLEFMEKRWEFKFKSKKEKLELLFPQININNAQDEPIQ